MRNFKLMAIFLVTLVFIGLTGCAKKVQKDWNPINGSRADGIVRLAIQYNDLEIPVTDDQQGLILAKKRCQSWGYSDTEPFGGVSVQMIALPYGFTRAKYQQTKEYQCIGQGIETSLK